MKPIIGVLPLYDEVRESVWMFPGYLNLVEENGGIPLILPLTANKETWQPFFVPMRWVYFYWRTRHCTCKI
jgi:putative glutamine amidotransferase